MGIPDHGAQDVTSVGTEEKAFEISEFQEFHGYQSSIIPLSNGHYFYLASLDNNPTRFARFSNVWLVTPDDRRILFSDPPESSEIVSIYHEFHEIYGASIAVERIGSERFQVRCDSQEGGYELEARFYVRQPLRSRALVAVGGGPPNAFRMSGPVLAVSSLLLNALVAKGGAILTGRTETGQPFYHADAEHLYLITEGVVRLNGEELKVVPGPGRGIEFGDSVPYGKPVIKLGTLHLLYE